VNAMSKNGVPIRLPDERWTHILTEHAELGDLRDQVLNTVGDPERILAGNEGELLAVNEVDTAKWLVVVYREFEDDGFIITAFLTRRQRSLAKRRIIWSR
jgi:hypothetical protein